MNFTQQSYIIITYYYREFPSKILSVHQGKMTKKKFSKFCKKKISLSQTKRCYEVQNSVSTARMKSMHLSKTFHVYHCNQNAADISVGQLHLPNQTSATLYSRYPCVSIGQPASAMVQSKVASGVSSEKKNHVNYWTLSNPLIYRTTG